MENNCLPKNWILIRGLIRSQFHWGKFPDLLKTELNLDTVHLTELAGNGYRCNENTPELIDQAVLDLKSQIQNLPTSYGLLGISLGGMIATRWAQLYPNEVNQLVLINSSSSLSPFYKRLNPSVYADILKNIVLNDPTRIEKFILSQTSNFTENWLPILKDYIAFQKVHPVRIKNLLRQIQLTSQVNFNEIPKFKKIILCSKKDRLVSPDCSQNIADAWKCPIIYHPTAGHDLPLDDADWIIQQLKT